MANQVKKVDFKEKEVELLESIILDKMQLCDLYCTQIDNEASTMNPVALNVLENDYAALKRDIANSMRMIQFKKSLI